MEALLEGAQDWLATGFLDLRKWSLGEVDNERLTWIRYYGTPVHAWSEEFFKFVVVGTGEFMVVVENTEKRNSLDGARILIRTKGHDIINFVERFKINGELFVIKMVKDWYGLLQ